MMGDVILSQQLLWSFGVSLAAFAILAVFFQRSRSGLLMRSTAEDHQVAQSMGISVSYIFALTWSIAAMVATLGGIAPGQHQRRGPHPGDHRHEGLSGGAGGGTG